MILPLGILAPFAVFAGVSTYYPSSYKEKFKTLRDKKLRLAIYEVLVKKHIKRQGLDDLLVSDCRKVGELEKCYGYNTFSYRAARRILFGRLHLEKDHHGHFIRDVYCDKEFTSKNANVGVDKIPWTAMLNCEHAWPQSKFNSNLSTRTQKTDLHHLFPVDTKANSIRSNHRFGLGEYDIENCASSRKGHRVFEPPEEYKGNLARALFYFSVRYKTQISIEEENTLRRWHVLDPVDEEEINRNNQIYKFQKNRNPFIDFPILVDRISDF